MLMVFMIIIVSRDFRAQPGTSGFGKHENVSLYKLYSQRAACRDWILSTMEVRSPS